MKPSKRKSMAGMRWLVCAIAKFALRYQASDDESDREHHQGCTLKDLKKFIDDNPDLPDSTRIMTERVHDHYFLNNRWPTLRVRSHYHPEQQSEYHQVWWPTREIDSDGKPVVALDHHF